MNIPKYQIFGPLETMLSFIREYTKEDSRLFLLSGKEDGLPSYIAIAPSEKIIQDDLASEKGTQKVYSIKEIHNGLEPKIF